MKRACWSVCVLLGVALAGCESPPSRGTVVEDAAPPQSLLNQPAPDIRFVASGGERASLHAVRQPVAVVAFVRPPETDCTALAEPLKTLAQRYASLPVSVVQVSEPVGACLHQESCAETRRYPDLRLIGLCDPQRVAWEAYGRPVAGTVFLVDNFGRVLRITTLNHVEELYQPLDAMAAKVRDEQRPSN